MMVTARVVTAILTTGLVTFFVGIRVGAANMRFRQLQALAEELTGYGDDDDGPCDCGCEG